MPNSQSREPESESQAQPGADKRKTPTATAIVRPEKIRAELNIEKWPAIWNPTHSKIHSKSHVQTRTLERETNAANGTKTISKVTINPIAHLGDLTTDDQRTLYALIKHWEDRGKPPHETPFSIRAMAKLLHKKGWGTNVIDAVTGSLERLRGTMLVWTRAYRSKDQRVEDSDTVYINILSKLKIIRRKVDGHVTTEAGYFQFDDHILKNLLTNYTKPFLFEVFMDIRGEIALKLYSYLDLIMADKPRFERCTRELFEDLGLKGAAYRHPSKRKQNLESAFRELTGIMLTTGVLKSATIEKTKDGKDYKAVFQKSSRPEFAAALETTTKFAASEPVIINDYSKNGDPLRLEAEELVRFFHLTFHGVTSHLPQSKETAQALSLITQHGGEKSRTVVEFAHMEAAKTGYAIQHFGAVLSYTSRALAAIGPQPATGERQPAAARQTRPAPREGKSIEMGERRLACLTAEQFAERFEKTKEKVFREQPFLAKLWRTGSKLHERAIRARMIRDLESEPMNLIVIGGTADPTTVRRNLGLQNLAL
jgi:hypothetical protein